MPSSKPFETTLSRRTVLRAGAGVGAVSLASAIGITAIHDPELPTALEPTARTWPLSRFGPRNTARAPTADPPAAPSVNRVSTTGHATTVVIGGTGEDRRVLVGGYDGLTAHRPDGSVVWEGSASDVVAIRPGTTRGYAAEGSIFRAFDVSHGRVEWQTDRSDAFAVVPTSRGTIVPFNGGIAFYDREGNERFSLSPGRAIGYAGVAVADELYVTDGDTLARLLPRGVWRTLRNRPPATACRVTDPFGFAHVPIIDGDEVYVTNERSGGDDSTVIALTSDGTVRWQRSLGDSPAGCALGPDRVYVATLTGGIDGGGERLSALSRTDGATEWTLEVEIGNGAYYADPVLAGDTLLVAGKSADGKGRIAAFARDGKRLWTVTTETEVWDIAPVGKRVYAVTKGGQLYILA